ncbi:MAG: hypothetical protein HY363_03225 [Candidatus Aenigmarchaeota archaeon]|nr:hypothetical protein [Candidatus Aenigmarchaeota archaeon]
MNNRKAQAAGLIGIITLLIIFYIIFLPPLEREKLLSPEKFENVSSTGVKKFLLDLPVGFLSALQEKEITHPVPNVVLEEVAEAKVLLEVPPFVVKRGWIGEQKKTFLFPIKNPETTKNVQLVFSLARFRGMLKVKINNIDVFEGTLNTLQPEPISIKSDILQQQNTVEVEATGTGIWFLPRIFELRNVKIIADIIEPAKLEASHIIPISAGEKENLDHGTLRFFAICDENRVGSISALLNGKQIFKATPDCGSINQQELFEEDFVEGKNLLTFLLDKGNARLEQLTLKNRLKQAQPFVQFFQVEKALKRATLKIIFVDDKSNKKAELNVNGQKTIIDQQVSLFEKDITKAIKLGNNFVSLTPLTDLKIVSLQVVAE